MSAFINTRISLNKTRRNSKRDAFSNGSNSNISIKEVIILQNKLEMTRTDIDNLLQIIISEVEKPSSFNIFDISGIKVNENINTTNSLIIVLTILILILLILII